MRKECGLDGNDYRSRGVDSVCHNKCKKCIVQFGPLRDGMLMKKLIAFLMLAGVVILSGVATFAAPIRPVGPVDITGTISEVEWFPEETVKGIPRMSGSAAKDRVIFPHFLIRLVDYKGVPAEAAVTMTRYLEWPAIQNQDIKGRPPFILLKIDCSDRTYLKKGMRIRVLGYTVAGDEGGTWTSFTGIEIR
jgi:hypothetical protein